MTQQPFIHVVFRRTDGSDIATCSLPIGAWLPTSGWSLDLVEHRCVEQPVWNGPVYKAGRYEDVRSTAEVLRTRYELFTVPDGDYSEVRYVVEVEVKHVG